MKRHLPFLYTFPIRLLGLLSLLFVLGIIRWFSDHALIDRGSSSIFPLSNQETRYRRHLCTCFRPMPTYMVTIDETSTSLCSQYATYRGFHQRVIAISMYGPKENSLFALNTSLGFLYELIDDMTKIYPGWILRIYHDRSIRPDIICSIECRYHHVDFCNATSLIGLGDVATYMPPKIWRFLPAGDIYVDIMASRDLDSPLVARELAAVNDWLVTNKSWHVMRDHPLHSVPMLGGLWAFRPERNRSFARMFLEKILNKTLIGRYGGRGDQNFLEDHVWSYIQEDLIVHDSYHCKANYGRNSRPWPTRRPPLNETGCFVGCVRPCCPANKFPFGDCPMACRPKNHPEWTMC